MVAQYKVHAGVIKRYESYVAVRVWLAVFVAVVAAMLLRIDISQAAETHPFEYAFSGSEPLCGGLVDEPKQLAVNEATDDLYATAHSNVGPGKVLDELSYTGGTLDCSAQLLEGFEGGFVAVDQTATATSGRIYVSDNSDGLVDVLDSAGSEVFQLHGTHTPAKSMSPFGVAVGPEGHLYVGDAANQVINVFEVEDNGGTYSEKYLTQFATQPYGNPKGLAVASSGEIYAVLEKEAPGVGDQKFVVAIDASGAIAGTIGPAGAVGVTVSHVTGDVFVAYPGHVLEYDSGGLFVARFGAPNIGRASAVAVIGSGESERIFVTDDGESDAGIEPRFDVFGPSALAPDVATGEASDVHQTIATVAGTINPDSGTMSAEYQFEYWPTGGAAEKTARVSVGSGTAVVPVSAELTGLMPNTEYQYRLLGYNANADGPNGRMEGEEASLITAGPPTVGGEQAVGIGVSEATVEASVTPNGADTHFYFEYGETAEYGSGPIPALPGIDIGDGRGAEGVGQTLKGLSSETVYHYRVVAESPEGRAIGPDEKFQTFSVPPPGGLPDGRAYELVSRLTNGETADVYSPAKLFEEATAGHVQPIESFEEAGGAVAVTYAGDPSSEGNGLSTNEYLARRDLSGWRAQDISPPTSGLSEQCPEENLLAAPYDLFTANLDGGVVTEVPTPALVAATGAPECYPNLFVRETADPTANLESYRAVIKTKPLHRVPAQFGFAPLSGLQPGAELVAGASPDLSSVFFSANDALQVTAGAVAVDGGVDENNLYEATAGDGLQVVNVPPGGNSSVPGAWFGAPVVITEPDAAQTPPDVTHAVADNGQRVFWTQAGITPTRLFLREGAQRTVQVDKVSGGSGTSGGGRFWTASVDGSKAFFTDTSALTKEAKPGSGANLYEFEAETSHLIDLTGNQTSVGVEGVVGASEDGSYVYFVAAGDLTGSETNSDGVDAGSGPEADNLYLYHAGGSKAIIFLARLSPQDNSIQPGGHPAKMRLGDWRGSVAQSTSRVTPDGRHMVLVSREPLTGYDNEGHNEVYLYSADANDFVCVSCGTGGRATGEAALVPDTTNGYQPRWVTDDGEMVFFDSDEALAAGDVNHTWDVYEYEHGRDYLISSGTSAEGSFFDDATPSGSDVFFTTRSKLTPEDENDLTNIYDARVGGGFPYTETPAPCMSEAGCRPTTSAAPGLAGVVTGAIGGSNTASSVVAVKATTVSIASVRDSRGAVTLSIEIAAKGRLVVASARTKRLMRALPKAGRYAVKLNLTNVARRLAARRGGLRFTLTIRFTASGGGTTTVLRTVTVKEA